MNQYTNHQRILMLKAQGFSDEDIEMLLQQEAYNVDMNSFRGPINRATIHGYDNIEHINSMVNAPQPNILGRDVPMMDKLNIPYPPKNPIDPQAGLIKNWGDLSGVDKGLGVASAAMGVASMGMNAYDNLNAPDIETTDMHAHSKRDLLMRGTNLTRAGGYDAGRTNVLGSTASMTGQGAAAGMSIGGPIGGAIGAGVGAIGGLVSSLFGNSKRKRKENEAFKKTQGEFMASNKRINQEAIGGWQQNQLAMGGILGLTKDVNELLRLKGNNMYALGGNMYEQDMDNKYTGIANQFAYGGDFSTGVNQFGQGNSHEDNPFGGILQGFDEEGNPNLVEEGEVKWNDYIFSDRFNVEETEEALLPEYIKGLSYADAAMKIAEEGSEREMDPISRKGRDLLLMRLAVSQEQNRPEELEGDANTFSGGGSLKSDPNEYNGDAWIRALRQPKGAFAQGPYVNSYFYPSALGISIGNASFEHLMDKLPIELQGKMGYVPTVENTPTINTKFEGKGKEFFDHIKDRGYSDEAAATLTAQLLLESNYGKSPSGNFNYGNITVGSSWKGEVYTGPDKDAEGNKITQKFRSYGSMEEGIDDFLSLLERGYDVQKDDSAQSIMDKVMGNNNAWGLKYAQDPKYAQSWGAVLEGQAGIRTTSGHYDVPKESVPIDLTTPTEAPTQQPTPKDTPQEPAGPAPMSEYQQRVLDLQERQMDEAGQRQAKEDARYQELVDQANTPDYLRYAPIVTNLGVLGSLYAENDPGVQLGRIAPTPVHERLSYTPIDSEYVANQARQQGQSAFSGIMDVAGGNRGMAQAGLLAANRGTQDAIGQAMFQGKEMNDAERERVMGFNRATSQYNSQIDMQAQQFNTNSFNQEQMMKYQADRERKHQIRQGWAGLGTTAGHIGTENMWRKLAPIMSGGYSYKGQYMMGQPPKKEEGPNAQALGGKIFKRRIK